MAAAEASAYRFPVRLLLRIGLSVVRRSPRSLGGDSEGGLRGAKPPPLVRDAEQLPATGPFVVVGNHYERPGLWAGWGAMAVNAAVRQTGAEPRELHWLMVGELIDFQIGPLRVPRAWLRRIFSRFASVYGFGLVTPRETGAVGGATGLRTVARYLAAGEPVGILPEGTASAKLQEARPGVGAAIAWLTRSGIPIVPVGISERGGALEARFGPPFALPPIEGDRTARDRLVRDVVMGEVAALVPPELRGYYALPTGPIEGEVSSATDRG